MKTYLTIDAGDGGADAIDFANDLAKAIAKAVGVERNGNTITLQGEVPSWL